MMKPRAFALATLIAWPTAVIGASPALAHTSPRAALAGSAQAVATQRGVFFGQTAHDGTLIPMGQNRYRLTLHGVAGQTPYFTDNRLDKKGTVSTADLMRGLFAGGPPIAAIELLNAPRNHDSLAVKLTAPHYDRSAKTVSYTAQPIADAPGSGRTPHGRTVDRSLAQHFDHVSLFLAGAHDGQYCDAEVFATDQTTFDDWSSITTFSNWSTDSWAYTPSLTTNSGDNSYMTWQDDGGDDRGCSTSVTIGYGAYPQPPSTVDTITANMTYAIGDDSTVSCTSTDPDLGTCSWSTYENGLFDTDLHVNYTITESG